MCDSMTKVNKRFRFDIEGFGNDLAGFGSAYLAFESWINANMGKDYASSVNVNRKPRRNPFSRKNVISRVMGIRQEEEYYIG